MSNFIIQLISGRLIKHKGKPAVFLLKEANSPDRKRKTNKGRQTKDANRQPILYKTFTETCLFDYIDLLLSNHLIDLQKTATSSSN